MNSFEKVISMSDEEIIAWYKKKFEELWKDLKKTPRGRMIAKTTRKYVAQYFFVAGMNIMLNPEEVDKLLTQP